MDVMTTISAYVTAHAGDLLNITTLIISAASAIAALTPTPKDDAFLVKLRGWVDTLALNIGNAKKQ